MIKTFFWSIVKQPGGRGLGHVEGTVEAHTVKEARILIDREIASYAGGREVGRGDRPDEERGGRSLMNRVPATNVLALVKGDERYVFLFTDEQRKDVLPFLGKFAANPELSFSWYDAAVLSQRIREQAAKQAEAGR